MIGRALSILKNADSQGRGIAEEKSSAGREPKQGG